MDVMSAADADADAVLKPIDVPDLGDHRIDVKMFIDCWTHMFMCIAIVLKMTEVEVDNIAEAGEYLKLCVGVSDVLKGGRRRRGGAGEELVGSTLAKLQELDQDRSERIADLRKKVSDASERIADLRTKVSDAKTKALAKFQKEPSLAGRLSRLLALVGVALLPIGGKLAEIGLKVKAAQIEHSARIAMITAPAQVAGLALLDATLTGLNAVDTAVAKVGQAAVEGAAAADTTIRAAATAVSSAASRIRATPGTRGEAGKQRDAARAAEIAMLRFWADADAALADLKGELVVYNQSQDVRDQQPPIPSGTVPGDLAAPQYKEKANPKTMDEVDAVLFGLKNFMSPVMSYVVLAGHLFKQHTIAYVDWSNTVAVVLFGIIVEDPATIGLCITWVMSSLAALLWITPLIEAFTKNTEVTTAIVLADNSKEAIELKALEKAEARAEDAVLRALALLDPAAPTRGGRRSTSRRYRRASGPRRTRRSSSGRRRGYSRRRRE